MADETILQLLIQARDMASQVIEKLKENVEKLPVALDKVNEAFKTLKILPTADIDAQKAKIIAAFEEIKNSGTATAEEIKRAEAAKNKAISDLNNANFNEQKSLLTSLKEHWFAVTAAVIAGWMAINKAAEWVKIGAAALQTEESFRNVTNAYGVNADQLIVKMKEVSVGAIEETELMQRAVKALQQGLSPDQIVSLLEVARVQARVAGTDIVSAFDGITNAVANQTTRALKLYGLVIDQNKAFENYAKVLGVSKDALNEQQQSQALANAVIAEGARQLKAMGDVSIDTSEKIQIVAATVKQFKEDLGKATVGLEGTMVSLLYSAAAGQQQWREMLERNISALLKLMGFSQKAQEWADAANASFLTAQDMYKKSAAALGEVDAKQKDVAASSKGLAKAGQDAADAAAINAAKQKQTAEEEVAFQQQKVKTLEATTAYETALEKKRYEDGEISLQEYIKFVQDAQAKLTEALIKEKQLQLAALQADTKISDTDRIKKEAEIQGAIERIKTDSATKQLTIEGDLTKDLLKEQQNAFDNWKTLQELKLQSLKANLDLQNTIDETMVKQGFMAQSELLQNQLDRAKTFDAARIAQAEATMQKIAELETQDLTREQREKLQKEYEQAYQEREDLQKGLEAKIIESETAIAEAKKKESQEAETFISALLEDSYRQDEVKRQEQLDLLNKFYKQGRISAWDYYDGLEKLDEQYTSSFKREMQDRTKQLNEYMSAIADSRQRLEDAISSMATTSFDDVRKYFANWGKVLSVNIDDMQAQINQFMKQTTWTSYDTFWSATLYGRKMVEMVGTSIYDWARRVSDYIQYVKGLMQSLREQIMSYQDQLDQLRGNEVAIIERWYQVELAKLKEQYAKELLNTKEYQEALLLLEELYREKRKRAAEQEAEEKKRLLEQQKEEAQSGTSSGVGGLSLTPSAFTNFAQQLQDNIVQSLNMPEFAFAGGMAAGGETIIKKETNVNATFEINTFDQEAMRRLTSDVIFPEFMNLLRLRGIEL